LAFAASFVGNVFSRDGDWLFGIFGFVVSLLFSLFGLQIINNANKEE
jgi:hypothetical protein